ncbi:MAG: hypothetical protein CMJ55_04670 [Planctomycetaceae bacterium]|nr:hypothetical protein [Planctomycetaceae bacterium]
MTEKFERHRLNHAPYSKMATWIFIILHLIAFVCHALSWFVGTINMPNDVLITPVAQLMTTQTEIVGPCFGTGPEPVLSAGVDSAVNACPGAPTREADGTAKFPITIGAPNQPRCTGVEIADGLSCGVDERHTDIDFAIGSDGSDKQRFKDINIFGLFIWVDLLSMVFHIYAIVVTVISRYRSVFAAIEELPNVLFKKKEDMNYADRKDMKEKMLPQPTKNQLHAPNYPRAPEYNRRWLDIALSFGVLTIATGIAVGITNFFVLLQLFLGVQMLSLLGFIIDDARYQLKVTDAAAYNANHSWQYIRKALKMNADVFEIKAWGTRSYIQQQHEFARPARNGWTQPVRNIGLCIGMIFLIWWGITFAINDAAENIIIQTSGVEGEIDGDAFKLLATWYMYGTGLIGFWMLLVLIGDFVGSDRSKATEHPPGNFILEQLDGDACFIILMFVTKIVVTWIAVGTLTEVYNFAGGRESRNEVASGSYLDKEIDGPLVRGLIIVLGVCVVGSFTILNWFLTPSSYMYCYVGQKIEESCMKCCKKQEEDDSATIDPIENAQQGLLKRDKLYF